MSTFARELCRPSLRQSYAKSEKQPPNSVNDSDPDCKEAGNPVVVTTGEKIQRDSDFQTKGLYALGLQRTYRSRFADSPLFGRNWYSTLDYQALLLAGCRTDAEIRGCQGATSLTKIESDGSRHIYTYNSDRGDYSISGNSSGGYFYGSRWVGYTFVGDEGIQQYDSAGKLASTASINGALILAFSYNAIGQLTKISAPGGRYVEFYRSGASAQVIGVRDPSGNTWSYTYDANKMLKTATSPDGLTSTTYHYDSPYGFHLLTGISINGARYSNYLYNSAGQVTESSHTDGETSDIFAYGAEYTTVTDAAGQSTTYTYRDVNGSRQIVSSTRSTTSTCIGASAHTYYDGNGYVDYKLDWRGTKTKYTYDQLGKLQSIVRAAGTSYEESEVYVWFNSRIKSIKKSSAAGGDSLLTEFSYYMSGPQVNLLNTIKKNDLKSGQIRLTTRTYGFFASKALASVITQLSLPNGETSTETENYTEQGDIASRIDPLGFAETSSGHNGFGLPSQMSSKSGLVTNYSYNASGLMVGWATINGRSRQIQYNGYQLPTTISNPDGTATKISYNSAGRPVAWGDAENNYIQRYYNVSSRQLTLISSRQLPALSGSWPTATSAGSFSQTSTYDSLGRLISSSKAGIAQTTYAYDANGNIISKTDGHGRFTSYQYDALNRLIRTDLPNGGSITISYYF